MWKVMRSRCGIYSDRSGRAQSVRRRGPRGCTLRLCYPDGSPARRIVVCCVWSILVLRSSFRNLVRGGRVWEGGRYPGALGEHIKGRRCARSERLRAATSIARLDSALGRSQSTIYEGTYRRRKKRSDRTRTILCMYGSTGRQALGTHRCCESPLGWI